MGMLSREIVSTPAASFAEGLEFEETFPETVDAPQSAPAPAPAVAAPPRLTVVRDEPEAADPGDALHEEQLGRRLREAEAMLKQTIERLRLEEEQRLADWVQQRRAEEERRLASWLDERRASFEKTLDQRSTTERDLARRIEEMLVDWQSRFEQRLEQRRLDDEHLSERRRQSDEDRLAAWRADLERALSARFADRREIAPLPDRNGELRSPTRDALRLATSARDVGRVMRDLMSEVAETTAFALSLHHRTRDEVAYRYRVASDDELGTLLRRDSLDDGPDGAAAHMDGWVRAHRTIRVGTRNVVVHTAQCAVKVADSTIGVLTLQTQADPVTDAALSRITDLVLAAAPRLSELRDSGAFRGA